MYSLITSRRTVPNQNVFRLLDGQKRFRKRNIKDPRSKRKTEIVPFMHSFEPSKEPDLTPAELYAKDYSLKPKFKNIIIIQDTKFGFKGEQLLMKNPRANDLINKQIAVEETPETLKRWVTSMTPSEKKKLLEKRRIMNYRKILVNGQLSFYRKVNCPRRDKIVCPVSREDLCQRVWEQLKVVVRPEQFFNWTKNIKTVGMHRVWLNVGDQYLKKDIIALRFYVGGGSKLNG